MAQDHQGKLGFASSQNDGGARCRCPAARMRRSAGGRAARLADANRASHLPSSSSVSAGCSACRDPQLDRGTGTRRPFSNALARAATQLQRAPSSHPPRERSGRCASFAVQLDDHVLYVASAEPPQELTLSFRAGRKAPLFCTSSGRLFLARLDDETLDQYLRNAELPAYTRYTNTDARKLRAELMNIRNRRYAITRQEYILHVVGAAVPVESGSGVLYGALSIAAPDVRMDGAGLKRAIPVLVAASNKLAKSLALVPSSPTATRGSAKRSTSAAGRCSTRPTPS